MVGKRLAAAGVLVVAVAATAALWVVPHAPLPAERSLAAQLRTVQLRAMRHAQSAATTATATHVFAPTALPTAQSAPALVAVGGVLFMLVLACMAARPQRRAVPATARSPHRGRAPPSPRGHLHSARTRNH
ncbi:hypothetical protein HC028_11510 [Planosporangium flavigriseum]|uniref:MYXO-CTERM domain-containing protein n=1 Tax=Planosporangium flavigriseum TaxID=373681 RepID=A0A8J3LRA7_9ACTN|nr:hypothetical protein [Planosporangium flavigriseum]NJC65124.1 hypothetical protein [Planosporangium flavigriseum]GIG71740.1 hypothetical protein Pfl04_01440 [Planosporangium flavigriseum]